MAHVAASFSMTEISTEPLSLTTKNWSKVLLSIADPYYLEKALLPCWEVSEMLHKFP